MAALVQAGLRVCASLLTTVAGQQSLYEGQTGLLPCLQMQTHANRGTNCTWLALMQLHQPVEALHRTLKSLDPCSGPRLSGGRVPPPLPLCLQDAIAS